MNCPECKNPLHHDHTNRGLVWRCRRPECPITEVDDKEIK